MRGHPQKFAGQDAGYHHWQPLCVPVAHQWSTGSAIGFDGRQQPLKGHPWQSAAALWLQPLSVSHRTMEPSQASVVKAPQGTLEDSMNGLIYLVGLVVVILAVLSFFGLR
jgi:hypothetical protein